MLISAAAVAATLGGWVAMAANDGSASAAQAQPPVISTLRTSAQSGLDTHRTGDAPMSAMSAMFATQPSAPLAMTRSSR